MPAWNLTLLLLGILYHGGPSSQLIDIKEQGEGVNGYLVKKLISESDSGSSLLSRSEAIPGFEAEGLAHQKRIHLGSIKDSGTNELLLPSDVTSCTETPSTIDRSPILGNGTPSYKDIPMSDTRRALAARLTDSKRDIPHYYVTSEIQMDQVNRLRASLNKPAADQSNFAQGVLQPPTKLTINDFVIKGAALACVDVPEVNSEWHSDFIRQFNTIDISVVVDTANGVCVPVLRDVGNKSLSLISAEVKALAEKARKNLITSDEYQGGGFMISNLGMYGSVSHFTSLIKPPQTCTLAVGGLDDKSVMDDTNEIKKIQIMKVTLALDHRALDGVVGAQWLQAFKKHMENPLSFML